MANILLFHFLLSDREANFIYFYMYSIIHNIINNT